ncbi:Free methionine-R-sulfoxide reductase [Penicillium canariense]|uniref:Free methionine-R-sulfoxide reductase n=1 Tax=Penicillium canariense TaxID=189055 RepID=A0A9W9LPJ7_9EURO|nr:Free methionine-R-sulfoxide reductase [Penicillium canariense]KAJ5167798.1 Free methionine-R-sulfoxide reductase [Penicillium canariense]
MPHADSSYFYGQTKAEVYSQLLEQAQGLLDGQRNWQPGIDRPLAIWPTSLPFSGTPMPLSPPPLRLSTGPASTFAMTNSPLSPRRSRPPPLPGAQGLGVTISTTYASPEDQVLLLGPFHGKPACQQIRFGKGVCGTAAASQKTVVVPDVLQFPGHIACDADSRSEIVVPIVIRGETVAIIDIDCTLPSGFDDEDQKYLEKLAELLAESCDW